MPTADGKKPDELRTGDSLQLYSAQFSLVKERKLLEASGRRFESWHVRGSPSGTGSFGSIMKKAEVMWRCWIPVPCKGFLPGNRRRWAPVVFVSDHAIAKSPVNSPQQAIVKNVRGQWRVLYDAGPGCLFKLAELCE